MDDRVTPCYARDFLRQHKVYGAGRQLPAPVPDMKMIAVPQKMIAF